jgi:hypothetical protein
LASSLDERQRNMKTETALGLSVPLPLIGRVDEVIE